MSNDSSYNPANNKVLAHHIWMSLNSGYRNEPFMSASDGVMVVPVNAAGEVLFIHEPTIFSGQPVMFLPGGAVDEGESPVEAANREMQEEIGFRAARLELLYEFHPLARHAQMRIFAVLARELSESRLVGDEPYQIPIMPYPLKNFERLLSDGGQQCDSTVIAALYMARTRILKESAAV
jgi:ADP-ribose diphosphatase